MEDLLPIRLLYDEQDKPCARHTNSLLQSITVFSLVLGVEKEYPENDTWPMCSHTKKKSTTLPSTQLSIRHAQARVLARPYIAYMSPR